VAYVGDRAQDRRIGRRVPDPDAVNSNATPALLVTGVVHLHAGRPMQLADGLESIT
jgi:hypothetical protein